MTAGRPRALSLGVVGVGVALSVVGAWFWPSLAEIVRIRTPKADAEAWWPPLEPAVRVRPLLAPAGGVGDDVGGDHVWLLPTHAVALEPPPATPLEAVQAPVARYRVPVLGVVSSRDHSELVLPPPPLAESLGQVRLIRCQPGKLCPSACTRSQQWKWEASPHSELQNVNASFRGVLTFSCDEVQPGDELTVALVRDKVVLARRRLRVVGYRGFAVVTSVQGIALNMSAGPSMQASKGMAALHRRLLEESLSFMPILRNTSFHFLSTGPLTAHHDLVRWLHDDDQAHFPNGSLAVLANGQGRYRAVAELIHSFPGRKFVLFGDVNARDDEALGAIARDFGNSVSCVLLRDDETTPTTPETPGEIATSGPLMDIDPRKLRFFRKARDLRAFSLPLVGQYGNCANDRTPMPGFA